MQATPSFRFGQCVGGILLVVMMSAAMLASLFIHGSSDRAAAEVGPGRLPIKQRHVDASREDATQSPTSERDQAIIDGWPLYRTARGQEAFNDAMATLAATDGPTPTAPAFKGCVLLACNVTLPRIGATGWVEPGRLWVSPTDYVLLVASPRQTEGRGYRRRSARSMRTFVFHEFHNSSRNTDAYDTISSHRSAMFVPFYMSKQATDARGRRFVIVVQVAPYDVVSIHATNHGSAGPGIEVAKNARRARAGVADRRRARRRRDGDGCRAAAHGRQSSRRGRAVDAGSVATTAQAAA